MADTSVHASKCRGDLLTQTARFLETRSLPAEPMLAWLGEHGAGCDCEVMFNFAQQREEKVGYVAEE